MSRMILAKEHGKRCVYGCCGTLPGQSFAGRHASETKRAVKRAMKKRDRREGKNVIHNDE